MIKSMINETLPIWIPPFIPCVECEHGFVIHEGIATKCECKKEYENYLKLVLKIIESNLAMWSSSKEQFDFLINYNLDLYKGKDLCNNISKIKKYVDRFEEKFKAFNLFFSGSPGTQKTTLAKHILVELLRKNYSGYYIIANDLIQLLIESARDEHKKNLLKELLEKDVLIIDEMDTEKVVLFQSNWQQKHLLPFLKNRLETIKKATIFISNRKINDLGKEFEGAIQDIIMREVVDHSMLFEDKYNQLKTKVDLSKIWDD